MTEYNLPEKDDAPWLDTTYDGFKIQLEDVLKRMKELVDDMEDEK